jgi:hypothetical protein
MSRPQARPSKSPLGDVGRVPSINSEPDHSSAGDPALSCPHPELMGMFIGDIPGFVCISCNQFFIEVICSRCGYSLEPYNVHPQSEA